MQNSFSHNSPPKGGKCEKSPPSVLSAVFMREWYMVSRPTQSVVVFAFSLSTPLSAPQPLARQTNQPSAHLFTYKHRHSHLVRNTGGKDARQQWCHYWRIVRRNGQNWHQLHRRRRTAVRREQPKVLLLLQEAAHQGTVGPNKDGSYYCVLALIWQLEF